MYNRYIRNDKGSYTRIPEDERQSEPSPDGGQRPQSDPPEYGKNSQSPPPPPNGNPSAGGPYSNNGSFAFTGTLRQILDQLHLDHVDTGDLLILILIFLLKAENADEELLTALALLLIL